MTKTTITSFLILIIATLTSCSFFYNTNLNSKIGSMVVFGVKDSVYTELSQKWIPRKYYLPTDLTHPVFSWALLLNHRQFVETELTQRMLEQLEVCTKPAPWFEDFEEYQVLMYNMNDIFNCGGAVRRYTVEYLIEVFERYREFKPNATPVDLEYVELMDEVNIWVMSQAQFDRIDDFSWNTYGKDHYIRYMTRVPEEMRRALEYFPQKYWKRVGENRGYDVIDIVFPIVPLDLMTEVY